MKNVLECFRGARGGKVASGEARLMMFVIYGSGLLLVLPVDTLTQ